MSDNLYNLIYGDDNDHVTKEEIIKGDDVIQSNSSILSTTSRSQLIGTTLKKETIKKEEVFDYDFNNELHEFFFPKKEEVDEGISNNDNNNNNNSEEADNRHRKKRKLEMQDTGKNDKIDDDVFEFDFEKNAREREFLSGESFSYKDVVNQNTKKRKKGRKKKRPYKVLPFQKYWEQEQRSRLRERFRKLKKYNFENEKDYGNAILYQIKSATHDTEEEEEREVSFGNFKKRGLIAPIARDVKLDKRHDLPYWRVPSHFHNSLSNDSPKNENITNKEGDGEGEKRMNAKVKMNLSPSWRREFFQPLKDKRGTYNWADKTGPPNANHYFPKTLFIAGDSHHQHQSDHATGTIYPTESLIRHHKEFSSKYINKHSYTIEEHVHYVQALAARFVFAKSFLSSHHYKDITNLTSDIYDHNIPSKEKKEKIPQPLHQILSILYKKDYRFNYSRYFLACAKEMATNRVFYQNLIQAPMHILSQYHENCKDSPPIKGWTLSMKDSVHVFLCSDSFYQDWVMRYFKSFTISPGYMGVHFKLIRKRIIEKTRAFIHQLLELSSQKKMTNQKSNIIQQQQQQHQQQQQQYQDPSYIINYLRSNMKNDNFNRFISTAHLKNWKNFNIADRIKDNECKSNSIKGNVPTSISSYNQETKVHSNQIIHQPELNDNTENITNELTNPQIGDEHDHDDYEPTENKNDKREDQKLTERSDFLDATMKSLRSKLKLTAAEKKQKREEKKELEWIIENEKMRSKMRSDREKFFQQMKEKKMKKYEKNLHLCKTFLHLSERGKDIYSAIDVYNNGDIPEFLDRYAPVSHLSSIDLSILSLTMTELMIRVSKFRAEAKEEKYDKNNDNDNDNDNYSSNDDLSENRYEYAGHLNSSWEPTLMKTCCSLKKLILEFLDESINRIIAHFENEHKLKFANLAIISAPLATAIEMRHSYIANSAFLQTSEKTTNQTKNKIIDDSESRKEEVDETAQTESFDNCKMIKNSFEIITGKFNFAAMAKELYSSGKKFVGDKRLIAFPEISLSVGIAKIASVLPSNLAEILSRSHNTQSDPVSRTPFEVIRVMLKELERSDEIFKHNRRSDYVNISSLCVAMHEASEIFESCTKSARVGEDGVIYHAWHLATILGLVCLKSGMSLDNGSSLANIGKPCFKIDDVEKKDKIEETNQSLASYRAHASVLLREFVDLDKNFDETRSYEGNFIYFHLSVMSLLEWKEAIILLVLNPTNDNETFERIRHIHAFHTLQWALLDGYSSSSFQRILSLWKSGEVSYDAVLFLLASRLEKNPAFKDNWMLLACALIPLECFKNKSQFLDQEKNFLWYQNRKDIWEHSFFYVEKLSLDRHQFTDKRIAEELIEESQNEETEFFFPFELYFNNGLNITDKRKSIDASKLYSLNQDSFDTTCNGAVLQERNFEDLLPTHISESNQLNISDTEILFELGLENNHTPPTNNTDIYEIVAYKIFIAAHLYGNNHNFVEYSILLLLKDFNLREGKIDKNHVAFLCLKWMNKCGMNTIKKLCDSKQLHNYSDNVLEDSVQYKFSHML